MSIDLEWNKLDSSLATHLVDVLNRHLSNAERPSFIGPIEVLSLDFGSTPPDVELIDVRDIYRDFLEDDDDDTSRGPVKVTDSVEDEEGFEWVSRRGTGGEGAFEYPPYGSASMFASPPSMSAPMPPWNPGMSLPNLLDLRTPFPNIPMFRSPSPATPFNVPLGEPDPWPYDGTDVDPESPSQLYPSMDAESFQKDLLRPASEPSSPLPLPQHQAPPKPHPNLQTHLHINWHSDLRVTLTTSLLINYPSPMFMSLPIKLSITGLMFNGELAVAYEGERRRVHICILDELDPYGPPMVRPKRDTQQVRHSLGSSPPDPEDELPGNSDIDIGIGIGIRPVGAGDARASKPLPVGQRLLPSIFIESEIGQADKHVLKNVTRVERFIQDVIRKTVEEELVFPNFLTVISGQQGD